MKPRESFHSFVRKLGRMYFRKATSGRRPHDRLISKRAMPLARRIVQSIGGTGPEQYCTFDDDLRIMVDLSDYLSCFIYYTGVFEPLETKVFNRLIPKGGIVFDVGAHIGYYTLLAAKRVGSSGKVHAFEPSPRTFEALSHNVYLNGFEDRVCLNQTAVSGDEGERLLYLSGFPDTGYASFSRGRFYRSTVSCRTVSLDKYCSSKGISSVSLVKMDIEGAETLALKGMMNLLSAEDAPKLLIEVENDLLSRLHSSEKDVRELLRSKGYITYGISSNSLIELPLEAPAPSRNQLFSKRPLVWRACSSPRVPHY